MAFVMLVIWGVLLWAAYPFFIGDYDDKTILLDMLPRRMLVFHILMAFIIVAVWIIGFVDIFKE